MQLSAFYNLLLDLHAQDPVASQFRPHEEAFFCACEKLYADYGDESADTIRQSVRFDSLTGLPMFEGYILEDVNQHILYARTEDGAREIANLFGAWSLDELEELADEEDFEVYYFTSFIDDYLEVV